MLKVLIIVIVLIITLWIKEGCDLIFSPFLKENKDCCSLESNVETKMKPKLETKMEPKVETVDILSDYIIVLSRENCPFCKKLVDEYISKTSKKYTVINLKSNLSFSFDNNFLEMEPRERENIIKGIQVLLSKPPILFPTIVYNKIITRGLIKSKLDNIFF
jgi:glutaredoxin